MNKKIPKLTIQKQNLNTELAHGLDYDIVIDGKTVEYRFLQNSEIVMIPNELPKLVLTYVLIENGKVKIDGFGNGATVNEEFLLSNLEITADVIAKVAKTH
ncbi:hypothetical protein [Leuconostoc mesenteroides]|uniref:hypothetical protein n=1 Tax=Leuconostoc mesenteroides TaxID=1245 RepID=UPI001C1F96D9|nr:hypothetical protein [Leuconostoc mesenteroides]MBU7546680.1 hypothetical protein [Leuconostoc mesenteroides]